MKRRSFLGFLGAGALVGAGAASQSARLSTFRQVDEGPARPPRRSDRLPDVPLLDQRGNRVHLYSDLIDDQIVLVSFFYTQCNGSCPATMGVLKKLRTRLPVEIVPRVRLVSLSLDPSNDDVGAMRDYAAQAGILDEPGLPRWDLLTGDPANLELARFGFGYRDLDPDVDRVRSNHAALITFGDDARDRWGTLPSGMPFPQLHEAVLRALAPRFAVES